MKTLAQYHDAILAKYGEKTASLFEANAKASWGPNWRKIEAVIKPYGVFDFTSTPEGFHFWHKNMNSLT
jgi:hypothetical protein